MNRLVRIYPVCIALALASLCGATTTAWGAEARVKPRTIVTTDGEVDDCSSMLRFFLYTCDFDVVGIIQVNSSFQQSGHSREKWIEAQLDQYEKIHPNLIKHKSGYPAANTLRGLLRVGNEHQADLQVSPDKMAVKNTEGEKLIIQTLLDDDPRPVHIQAWGGLNTVASALWRLKYSGEYTKPQFDHAVKRVRIYAIWFQDGGGKWIENNVKEACIYEACQWHKVSNSSKASFVVPSEPGTSLHVICEVKDDGAPALTSYRRAIFKIVDKPTGGSGTPTHGAAPATPTFPLKVSENKRYLQDAGGKPFFLLGEGAWFPPFRLTREEIAEYFDARKKQGFNAFIIDVLDETSNPRAKNKYGQMAFDPPGDFSKPNEAYFKYIDEIVAMARERDLVLLLTVTYLGPGEEGVWVKWVKQNGPEKSAGFARWLATRYKDSPNIIWVLNGDRDAKMGRYDVTAEVDAQGHAIRQANPAALITVHDSPHTDHYEFQQAPWHDLVWVYSYRIPTSPLANMYYTSSPTRPVYLIRCLFLLAVKLTRNMLSCKEQTE